jgi:hypothetical protein
MFDVIVSFTVLQHITDPDELALTLRNLRRMLKDDGRLFVLEFSPRGSLPRTALTYMHFRTYRQWLDVITREGFDLVSSGGVRFIGYRLYAVLQKLRHGRRSAATAGLSSDSPVVGSRLLVTSSLRAIWPAERIVGRIPWLNQRSDVHAFVFNKHKPRDQQAASALSG